MKKVLVLMVAATLLYATACNKDDKADKEDEQTATCLLTKETYVYDDGNYVQIFTYNSDRRVEKMTWEGDNDKATFKYGSDGKLIEILMSWEDDEGTIGESRMAYSYSDNTMTILYAEKENGNWVNDDKEVYDLNSDGKASKSVWYENENGNDNWTEYATINYTWINGNVTKEEYTDNKKSSSIAKRFKKKLQAIGLKSIKDINSSEITTYEYDNKNNSQSSIDFFKTESKNNVTKEVYIYDGNTNSYTYTYIYEYNDKDFPTKSTEKVEGYDDDVTLYEYNCN